jgi:hypothetical protein
MDESGLAESVSASDWPRSRLVIGIHCRYLISCTMSTSSAYPPESVDGTVDSPNGVCALCYTPLRVDEIVASVGDDGAGATAVFIGTTRNSFRGTCTFYFRPDCMIANMHQERR